MGVPVRGAAPAALGQHNKAAGRPTLAHSDLSDLIEAFTQGCGLGAPWREGLWGYQKMAACQPRGLQPE
jgi:hypothetical protein